MLTRQKYLQHFLSDWKFAVFWNKLFRSSLLDNIRFPVGRKIDDEFLHISLYVMQKDCKYYRALLFYRMRKSSVMNNNAKNRLIYDRIDCFVERYEYVSSRFPKLRKTYYNKLSDSLLLYKSKLGTDDDKLKGLFLNIHINDLV